MTTPITDADMDDDEDVCPLCAGVGEISASTERGDRDTVECPYCVARDLNERLAEAETRIDAAEAKVAKVREALGSLVDAVGRMRVPQNDGEVALLISVTLGPVYETAARAYRETQ